MKDAHEDRYAGYVTQAPTVDYPWNPSSEAELTAISVQCMDSFQPIPDVGRAYL